MQRIAIEKLPGGTNRGLVGWNLPMDKTPSELRRIGPLSLRTLLVLIAVLGFCAAIQSVFPMVAVFVAIMAMITVAVGFGTRRPEAGSDVNGQYSPRTKILLLVSLASGLGLLCWFALGVVDTIRNNERLLLGVEFVEGITDHPPRGESGLFTDSEVDALVAERVRQATTEPRPDHHKSIRIVAEILRIGKPAAGPAK